MKEEKSLGRIFAEGSAPSSATTEVLDEMWESMSIDERMVLESGALVVFEAGMKQESESGKILLNKAIELLLRAKPYITTRTPADSDTCDKLAKIRHDIIDFVLENGEAKS